MKFFVSMMGILEDYRNGKQGSISRLNISGLEQYCIESLKQLTDRGHIGLIAFVSAMLDSFEQIPFNQYNLDEKLAVAKQIQDALHLLF